MEPPPATIFAASFAWCGDGGCSYSPLTRSEKGLPRLSMLITASSVTGATFGPHASSAGDADHIRDRDCPEMPAVETARVVTGKKPHLILRNAV